MEHHDYPHIPGSLPQCPACDLLLAREAFEEISHGHACPNESLDLLDDKHRRLVEIALLVEQESRRQDIPVRDALHAVRVSDRVKAVVAEWVCPASVSDFSGGPEQRNAARLAAAQRRQERIDDDILDQAASLQPGYHSLQADGLRETAASIRDHRISVARMSEGEAREVESQLEEDARKAFRERDMHRAEAVRHQANLDWEKAALSALAMSAADKRGNELILTAIEKGREADDLARIAKEYEAANRRYEEERYL